MIGVAASHLLWDVLPVVEAICYRWVGFGTLLYRPLYITGDAWAGRRFNSCGPASKPQHSHTLQKLFSEDVRRGQG